MQPRLMVPAVLILTVLASEAADPQWKHLSSSTGDLPVPGPSTQQTGAIVADFDKDGTNDFVLSFRQFFPPASAFTRRAWLI